MGKKIKKVKDGWNSLSKPAQIGIIVVIVLVIVGIALGVGLGVGLTQNNNTSSSIPPITSFSFASFSSPASSSSSVASSAVASSIVASSGAVVTSKSIFSNNKCQILLALGITGTNVNFGSPVTVVGPFSTVVPPTYDPITTTSIGFIGVNAFTTPSFLAANAMFGVFPNNACLLFSSGTFANYSMNFLLFQIDNTLPNDDPFLITAGVFRFNSNPGTQVATVPITTPSGTVPSDLVILAQNGLNPGNTFSVVRANASTASTLLVSIVSASGPGVNPANLNYLVIKRTNNLNPNPFNSPVLYANPHTVTINAGTGTALITLLTSVTGISIVPVWYAMSGDNGIQTIMFVTAIRPVSTTQVIIDYINGVAGLATFFIVCLQDSGQPVSNPPISTTFGIQ